MFSPSSNREGNKMDVKKQKKKWDDCGAGFVFSKLH